MFLIIGAWWSYKTIKRRNKIKLKEKHFKQNGGLLLKKNLTTFDGSVDTSKLFNSKELDKFGNYVKNNLRSMNIVKPKVFTHIYIYIYIRPKKKTHKGRLKELS